MNHEKREDAAKRTLLKLWLGIFLSFVLFEVTGVFFAANRAFYTLGLLMGCATASLLAWNMYDSLDTALDMEEASGKNHLIRQGMIRKLLVITVVLAGIKLPVLSLPAVLLGIWSLKLSALIHPYIDIGVAGKTLKRREG